MFARPFTFFILLSDSLFRVIFYPYFLFCFSGICLVYFHTPLQSPTWSDIFNPSLLLILSIPYLFIFQIYN